MLLQPHPYNWAHSDHSDLVAELNYWTRRSPFFECTRRAGCKSWAVANHMYQPSAYGDPVEEYWHLVEGVTLWDVGTERQVEIRGRDAAAFVDYLTPRNIGSVAPGKCRYLIVTSPEGGIVNDPVMLRLAEDRFWLSCSDSDLLLWAKGVAVHAGMEIEISEPDVSPLQIQGPKSKGVVDALFGPAVAALPYYALAETRLGDIPVVVTRTGWSGEFGYEVFLRDSRYAGDLWQRILDAGRPLGLVVTGPSDIRRVEAGILGYRADIDLDTNPFEAGMERMLDLDSGCDFIGREALLRIREEGPKRRIVGIELGGDALPQGTFQERWAVSKDGQSIGEATIALYSPRLEKNIGFAMLRIEHTHPGTALSVASPLGDLWAEVVELPFVKPTKA